MRKILLLSLGGAVGFVVGARAGRSVYDRLARRWSDVATAVGVGELAATVKEAGVDVRDGAVSRASAAFASAAGEMVDGIDPDPSMDDDTRSGVTSRR